MVATPGESYRCSSISSSWYSRYQYQGISKSFAEIVLLTECLVFKVKHWQNIPPIVAGDHLGNVLERLPKYFAFLVRGQGSQTKDVWIIVRGRHKYVQQRLM